MKTKHSIILKLFLACLLFLSLPGTEFVQKGGQGNLAPKSQVGSTREIGRSSNSATTISNQGDGITQLLPNQKDETDEQNSCALKEYRLQHFSHLEIYLCCG
jgi:hypothetical protein